MLSAPGAGNSRLARRLTAILLNMALAEAIKTTRIHLVVGRTSGRLIPVAMRPCRCAYHPHRWHGRWW
jgi:predicted ATPase with chaperone activity